MITFWDATAFVTSAGVNPLASIFCISRSTIIWRTLPPIGSGTCAPSTFVSWTLMLFCARSVTFCNGNFVEDIITCNTGIVVGVYFKISGGRIPKGIFFIDTWEDALIWVIAVLIFAPGCKNTLITPTPNNDWDSICSISFTFAAYPLSAIVTILRSISFDCIPVYVHTAVTTGVLISGNTSIGVLTIDNIPIIKINRAITITV